MERAVSSSSEGGEVATDEAGRKGDCRIIHSAAFVTLGRLKVARRSLIRDEVDGAGVIVSSWRLITVTFTDSEATDDSGTGETRADSSAE